MSQHADDLLQYLTKFAARDEDGIRNVVAECLGKLAVVSDIVLPSLEQKLQDPDALMRGTVINSLRYALTEVRMLIGGDDLQPQTVNIWL